MVCAFVYLVRSVKENVRYFFFLFSVSRLLKWHITIRKLAASVIFNYVNGCHRWHAKTNIDEHTHTHTYVNSGNIDWHRFSFVTFAIHPAKKEAKRQRRKKKICCNVFHLLCSACWQFCASVQRLCQRNSGGIKWQQIEFSLTICDVSRTKLSTHIRFAFDAQTTDIRLFFEKEVIFIGEQLTERDLLFTHLRQNMKWNSVRCIGLSPQTSFVFNEIEPNRTSESHSV